MRKALSISMVLLLLLSMAVPASAAGTPTLSISSGEVKAGESITLTVSIKDNPGIAACLVYIYFDTNVFSFKKAVSEGNFETTGSVMENEIADAKETGLYDGEYNKDGHMVLWFNNGGRESSADGEFITVTLITKNDAPNGEYTIGIGYSKDNTCDEHAEPVSLKCNFGTVVVSGGKDEKRPENAEQPEFTDIEGNWAEDYILKSRALGLVEGYEGLYRPNDTMTRAEFVTILWRSVGEPEPKAKASFVDLKQDWYVKSVAWAEENQIVNGMGGGMFDPTGSVTREQLVTILHRLAGNPMGMETMLTSVYDGKYSDSNQIGDWAKQSLYWAIYEGIYCGENAEDIGDMLSPKNSANRAQIAVMIVRYLESN